MTEREQQQYDLEGMQYAEMRHSGPMLPAQITEQYSAIQRRTVGDSTPVVIQKVGNPLPGFVAKGIAGGVFVVIIGKAIFVSVTAVLAWMEANILASTAIAGGFAFVVYLASGWREAVGGGGSGSGVSSSGGNTYIQNITIVNQNGSNGLK